MDPILQRFASDWHGPCAAGASDRVLVAVSGGLDSMVLLHLLHQTLRMPETRLTVAHFNHQLRGRASDADERFVVNAAAVLGLSTVLGAGKVSELAKEQGISIEMAARELRYAFLAQAASEQSCQVITTAHHADDQLELFFIRAARGAGGEGLGGMAPRRVFSGTPRVDLLRPLLGFSRRELEAWARERKIRFREDASNRSDDILRNRVRHQLIPQVLRQLGPQSPRLIRRSMELVESDAEFVAGEARVWLSRTRPEPAFETLHVALQRQVMRLQLLDLGIAPEFQAIEFLRSHPGEALELAAGLRVRREDRGRIHRLKDATVGRFRPERLALQLKGRAGKLQFSGCTIRWSVRDRLESSWVRRPKAGIEVFDLARLGDSLELRHWAPGDRFRPLGAAQPTKLQDFFVNRKVPAGERRDRVVLANGQGTPAWVEGFAPGDEFKVQPDTGRFLVWRWSRP